MDDKTNLWPEESPASLLRPDPALPARYFEIVGGRARLEPEKRLMLAVLQDAVACIRSRLPGNARRGGIFRAAKDWIEEEETDRPFSCANICAALGMDPRRVRRELNLWKETKPADRRGCGKDSVSRGPAIAGAARRRKA